MLDRTTIPRRLRFGYALMMLVMLMMGAVMITGFVWIVSWNDSYRSSQELTQAASTLSEASADMVLAGTGVLMSQNETTREQFNTELELRTGEAERALATLARLTATDAEASQTVEWLPGWPDPTRDWKELDDLPKQARTFLDRIAELMNLPISVVSVGPRRDQSIVLGDPLWGG